MGPMTFKMHVDACSLMGTLDTVLFFFLILFLNILHVSLIYLLYFKIPSLKLH